MTMNDIISSSSPSSRHEKKDFIAMSAKGTKQSVVKFKKAPEAPKNPKTAFFFFSMHMHEEKKRGISGVLDISKTVCRFEVSGKQDSFSYFWWCRLMVLVALANLYRLSIILHLQHI